MNKLVLALIAAVAFPVLADIIHVPGEYPTIQQGIDAAQPGDIVLVAPGRYPEEIQLKASVIVRGAGEGRSIIDGQDDPGDVVRATGNAIGPDTKLEGFTITGALNGGGMPGGGGVFCNSGARPDIGNCRIEGNDAGVDLWNGSTAYVHNCVVVNNVYDGISTGSGGTIVNNTIHNCRIGFYDYSGYGPVFMNNIVTGCSQYGVYGPSGGTPPSLTYNDVWGNATNYQQAVPGVGSISHDPLYADTSAGDYHLASGSPCIDSGNPAVQYNDPDGTRNDMGAYGGPAAVSSRPQVTTLVPARNALNVSRAANVAAGFNVAMNPASVNGLTFAARGLVSGTHYGAVSYDTLANVALLDPAADFAPGEPVAGVLAKGIVSAGGESLPGLAWDFVAAAAGGSAQFSETLQMASGSYPCWVAGADFNSDGITDLAAAKDGIGQVSVYLGLGNGRFGPGHDLAAGTSSRTFCCGDFNMDTIPDLAVGNGGSNNISVFIGLGNGDFAPAVNYPCVSMPIEMAASDVNLDGHPDLVGVASSPAAAFVLAGNGDGTFGSVDSFPFAGSPASLGIGDLNQDGFQDLCVADAVTDDVMVLLGKGDATFDSLARFRTGSVPCFVRLGDFNADGVLDAAVVSMSSSTVSVFRGDGMGRFVNRTDYAVGDEPHQLAVADLDGDGRLDIATVNRLGNSISVLRGNGDGTFRAAASSSADVGPICMTCADFDSDGDLDVVVGSYTSGLLTTLLNDNALRVISTSPRQHGVGAADTSNVVPTFSLPLNRASLDSTSFLVYGSETGLHRGPIAYDSATLAATLNPREDFASGEKVTAMLTTRVQSRTGVNLRGFGWNFTSQVPTGSSGAFAAQTAYPTGAEPRGLWCADFDHDGDIDVATTCNSPASVAMLANNGDGTFAAPVYTGVNSDPITLFGADLDSDGDVDLACFHNQPGTSHLEILKNNGSGGFVNSADYAPAVLGQDITGGDLDSDGDVDLVLTDGWGSQNNVRIMWNNGSGSFTGPTNCSAGSWARGVTVTDVDNDGDMDICVANEGNNNVSVLLNDGTGAFPRMANYNTGSAPEGVYANDVNNDGWVDLAAATVGDTGMSVLLNDGTGGFMPAARYSSRVSCYTIDGGDFQGRSSIDLCLSASGTDSVAVLRNNGDGTFLPAMTYRVSNTPWRIKTADFNRDGALDLATTDYYTNSVSILLATGLGVAANTTRPLSALRITPNPARAGFVTVYFSSTLSSPFSLSVFDVSGRRVRSFPVSCILSTVSGSIVWDCTDSRGRRVAPGVFFVRLDAGTTRRVEKLILTR